MEIRLENVHVDIKRLKEQTFFVHIVFELHV